MSKISEAFLADRSSALNLFGKVLGDILHILIGQKRSTLGELVDLAKIYNGPNKAIVAFILHHHYKSVSLFNVAYLQFKCMTSERKSLENNRARRAVFIREFDETNLKNKGLGQTLERMKVDLVLCKKLLERHHSGMKESVDELHEKMKTCEKAIEAFVPIMLKAEADFQAKETEMLALSTAIECNVKKMIMLQKIKMENEAKVVSIMEEIRAVVKSGTLSKKVTGLECANCAIALSDGGHKCARCKNVAYCGKACQGQHWREGGHKGRCVPVADRAPKVLPPLKSDTICVVCREGLEGATTLKCGHSFHGHCLAEMKAFETRHCPCCRDVF